MFIKLNILVINLLIVCVLASKLKVGVYFESLCPDSKRFITQQLSPTYDVLSKIFDIQFIPFGNSKWTYNRSTKQVLFECQHGPLECFGSRIQSCFIGMSGSNTRMSLEFIDCMFSSDKWKRPDISAQNCSQHFGVDWSALYHCSIGPYSTILQLEMSNKTNSLNPPQNWIPWITIDGRHSSQIQSLAETDLKKLICDYHREELPTECLTISSKVSKYESFPFNRFINREGIIEP